MRKPMVVILMLALAWALHAQAIDPTQLDFSNARVSMAGPNSVYIRSVFYAGQEVSVILEYDGGQGATIKGPFLAADKFLKDSYDVEYASIKKVSPTAIEISGVILGGQGYSGVFEWVPGTSTLTLKSYSMVGAPTTYPELVGELNEANAQVVALKNQVDAERKKADELTGKLSQAAMAAPAVEKPANTVFSGLKGGTSRYGTWKESMGTLAQTADLKYAKYSFPLNQSGELLYSFTAQAKEKGWIGYGLHLFASGAKDSKLYGFGNSYLVWLTRDPGYYKWPNTYVQLYRSFDDVRMIQVASVSISISIGSAITTEVWYQPAEGTIAVSVDGRDVLHYMTDDLLTAGDTIALRTLGTPVEFTALVVKAK